LQDSDKSEFLVGCIRQDFDPDAGTKTRIDGVQRVIRPIIQIYIHCHSVQSSGADILRTDFWKSFWRRASSLPQERTEGGERQNNPDATKRSLAKPALPMRRLWGGIAHNQNVFTN